MRQRGSKATAYTYNKATANLVYDREAAENSASKRLQLWQSGSNHNRDTDQSYTEEQDYAAEAKAAGCCNDDMQR